MEAYEKISEHLLCLRQNRPLVHHITNYVTANDCANITLAIGASPVMADDINEVEEIVALASSLVINLGTMSPNKLESMLAAGLKANELGIPIVLDPVGVSATPFRLNAARKILRELKLTVVKGNLAEIKALCGIEGVSKGVDSLEALGVEKGETLVEISMARELALNLGAVIAITGAFDYVTDGDRLIRIENGNSMMSQITGTGCMCTSLIGSFLGVCQDGMIAAAAGICSMGIAGDRAYERLDLEREGIGSMRAYMMDAAYRLCPEDIMKRGKIYEY